MMKFEYKNNNYALFNNYLFELKQKDNNFSFLIKRATSDDDDNYLIRMGFSNEHVDYWGEAYKDNIYIHEVRRGMVDAAYSAYTYALFKGEKCQAVELKENKIKLVITSQKLALELGQDYYNGFQWEVNENELDEIWEEIAPIEGFPFPKDYPNKIILYSKNMQD